MGGMNLEKNFGGARKPRLLFRPKRVQGFIKRFARLDFGKNKKRSPSQDQVDLTDRRLVTLGE